MPTYQYACTECGHGFETVQSFSDAALTDCPQCTGRLRKIFNSVGIVFKGSGFYRTDSREKPKDGAVKGGKEDAGKSSGDTKSDTKKADASSSSTASAGSASSSSGSSAASTGSSSSSGSSTSSGSSSSGSAA